MTEIIPEILKTIFRNFFVFIPFLQTVYTTQVVEAKTVMTYWRDIWRLRLEKRGKTYTSLTGSGLACIEIIKINYAQKKIWFIEQEKISFKKGFVDSNHF